MMRNYEYDYYALKRTLSVKVDSEIKNDFYYVTLRLNR
jgi:hypothetical protein